MKKILFAFCVLFVAITWLSMLAQPIAGYTVWDVIEATLRSDRGMWLMVAAVVLALVFGISIFFKVENVAEIPSYGYIGSCSF